MCLRIKCAKSAASNAEASVNCARGMTLVASPNSRARAIPAGICLIADHMIDARVDAPLRARPVRSRPYWSRARDQNGERQCWRARSFADHDTATAVADLADERGRLRRAH